MRTCSAHWNLVLAWLWILFGFVGGFVLGLNFHREDWLGGYTSHPRRLYRLGHISFFGLSIINAMFYLTAQQWPTFDARAGIASWGFLVGAVSMPICCVVMAHRPAWRGLFLIPVGSLITGALLTLIKVIKL